MHCHYCEGITVEGLIELDKEDRKSIYYGSGFASNVCYAHHLTFESLIISAQGGCEFCSAIYTEFRVANLLKDITKKELLGLGTNVSICIGVSNKEAKHPDQVYDSILVGVGHCPDLDDESETQKNPQNTSENELDDSDSHSLSNSEDSLDDEMIDQEMTDDELMIGLHVPSSNEQEPPAHSVCSSLSDEDMEVLYIKFSLTRYEQTNLLLYGKRIGLPNLGFKLNSPQNFNLARTWLHTCALEHHESNCPPIHDHILPTRLIDIGSQKEDRNPKLCIAEGRYGRYVALSHCWGGKMSVRTTQTNIYSHIQGLQMDSLPQNFRDAIMITQELGFRYLWIDSLCIIQDSHDDWTQESSKMGDIYRNAAITIVAAAARNSEAGIMESSIFQSRNFKIYCSLKLSQRSSNAESLQVSTFYGEEMHDCLFTLPVCRRGWTFQERLLSQRVLHYGRAQIHFQCRTSQVSAHGLPHDKFSMDYLSTAALLDIPQTFRASDFITAKRRAYDKWQNLVESYCIYRRLTIPDDKLPAMAGLASVFYRYIKDQYLAGIWRGDFSRSLMWMVVHNKHNKVIKHEGRAPSWSWARWDGYIGFDLTANEILREHPMADLVNYDIRLAGQNPFGQINAGSLHIRAWTLELSPIEISKLGILIVDHCDDDSNKVDEPERLAKSDFLSFSALSDHSQSSDQSYRLLEAPTYTVMMVGTFVSFSSGHTIQPLQKKGMLILKSSTAPESGIPTTTTTTYERVGIAFYRSDSGSEFSWAGAWSHRDLIII